MIIKDEHTVRMSNHVVHIYLENILNFGKRNNGFCLHSGLREVCWLVQGHGQSYNR